MTGMMFLVSTGRLFSDFMFCLVILVIRFLRVRSFIPALLAFRTRLLGIALGLRIAIVQVLPVHDVLGSTWPIPDS